MNIVETKRLILRNIIESDAEDIFDYAHNPNVGINAGWEPHKDLAETKIIMKDIFLDKPNIFGIILKEKNKLIGTVGFMDDPLRNNPNALMLGYALSEDFWGMGIMSEASKAVLSFAFNKLKVDIVSCSCYTENLRSKKVILKSGFKRDGVLRECEQRYDGKIMDLECFSITKKEWTRMTV
ncbi:MAG: GNAT family protein [Bacteroidales bacterium]|nr:GNAT family protein [Bacteroidales bacterium]